MTHVHPSHPGQSVLVGQVAKEKGTEELAWALRVSSESCPWESEESWGLDVLLRKNCSPESSRLAAEVLGRKWVGVDWSFASRERTWEKMWAGIWIGR